MYSDLTRVFKNSSLQKLIRYTGLFHKPIDNAGLSGKPITKTGFSFQKPIGNTDFFQKFIRNVGFFAKPIINAGGHEWVNVLHIPRRFPMNVNFIMQCKKRVMNACFKLISFSRRII